MHERRSNGSQLTVPVIEEIVMTPPHSPTRVLWLYGADAVGKSTVAWEIYTRVTEAGEVAAYVDTDYLGFCSSVPREEVAGLVATNLSAIWPQFANAGATSLIVAGVVVTAEQRELFRAAIPDARLMLCRLRASPSTQRQRILRRARAEGLGGGGAATGLSDDSVDEYARSSAQFAELLDVHDLADFTVDTDNLTVPEVATAVQKLAGL